MTCVVGLARNGHVWIGADSVGSDGHRIQRRRDGKVFRNGPYLMGFTSSFRMGQLLQYKLNVAEQLPSVGDVRHMSTVFIDAVRQCLKDGGFAKTDNGAEEGGTFLVGYKGQLYEIESDFQVGQVVEGYAAVGSGEDYALAALHTMITHGPGFEHGEDWLITKAIEVADRYVTTVGGKIVVEHLS